MKYVEQASQKVRYVWLVYYQGVTQWKDNPKASFQGAKNTKLVEVVTHTKKPIQKHVAYVQ